MNNTIRLDIERRESFAGGVEFDGAGPYERLLGKAYFAIDPDEPDLPYICDLDLAPRNADGRVEFSCVVDIVKPVDLSKGSDRVLYEFSNRGGRAAFRYSDGGGWTSRSQPSPARVSCSATAMQSSGPAGRATRSIAAATSSLTCRKRSWTASDCAAWCARSSSPGSPGFSRWASVKAPNAASTSSPTRCSTTAARRSRSASTSATRVTVPDDDWELAIAETKDGKLEVTPSNEHLYIKGGFKPGWIYELIYETEGSKVMGLGFLGVRDLTSFLKFGDVDSAGNPNPLAGHVKQMYGFGVSLSGRVVRQYIYEGWNQDTEGRKLLDGVHSHTGSGRLLHNQRFAQVGRYPRQHEEHQWPSERYPLPSRRCPTRFRRRTKACYKDPTRIR